MAVEKYDFDPSFERTLVVMCCTRPKVFGSIGRLLEVDALNNLACKLAIKAAKEIFKELGHGPSSGSVLMQRIKRWEKEGKVDDEDRNSVFDLLMEASIVTEGELINEVAPVLKKRMRHQAIRDAIEIHGRDGDLDRVAQMISDANRIGNSDNSVGIVMGPNSFSEIEELNTSDRMPLGIPELDTMLRGGLRRGGQCVFIARSGFGKSMMLCHTAANGVEQGYFVCYATTELSRGTILARIKSNLTGIPIDDIEEDKRARKKAKKILGNMNATLGTLIVQDFAPKTTTVLDIKAWVKESAEHIGYKPNMLIVDYADELGSHNKADQNSYEVGGTVYESMRQFVKEEGMWNFTASQPKGGAGKDKHKRIDMEDVADSMKKIRKADMVITMNGNDQGDQVDYFIAKHRHGKSRFMVGPIPHDWTFARMCPRE